MVATSYLHRFYDLSPAVHNLDRPYYTAVNTNTTF